MSAETIIRNLEQISKDLYQLSESERGKLDLVLYYTSTERETLREIIVLNNKSQATDIFLSFIDKYISRLKEQRGIKEVKVEGQDDPQS